MCAAAGTRRDIGGDEEERKSEMTSDGSKRGTRGTPEERGQDSGWIGKRSLQRCANSPGDEQNDRPPQTCGELRNIKPQEKDN